MTSPTHFIQNRVPKLRQSDLMPAEFASNPEFEWCPPGHGDIYCCLNDSGILKSLLSKGYKYAFISNSDNLGAQFDTAIAGYLAKEQIPFLMEVAKRTASDRKGGHLAKSKNEQLILRERAQCPEDAIDHFENIEKYSYFNTNSLWINLEALKDSLDKHDGFLDLPLIINSKTINPANLNSEAVYQLETAMGAAISVFPEATALHVPRTRFAPVKTTNDLLELWSDNFKLSENFSIERTIDIPPVDVQLDSAFYKNLSDFKQRFPHEIPDLKSCEKLEVIGDVVFLEKISLDGNVRIINNSGTQKTIPGNQTLSGEIKL